MLLRVTDESLPRDECDRCRYRHRSLPACTYTNNVTHESQHRAETPKCVFKAFHLLYRNVQVHKRIKRDETVLLGYHWVCDLKSKQIHLKGVNLRPLTDAAFKKGVRSETVTIRKFCPMKALHNPLTHRSVRQQMPLCLLVIFTVEKRL